METGSAHPAAGPEKECCPLCGRAEIPAVRDWNVCCAVCGAVIRPLSLRPGDMVGGRYRILKSLGEGGYGTVYLVNPPADLAVRYVVKSLRTGASATSVRRFVREAEILQAIRYESIVRLVDYWRDDSGYFLAMEYVEGETLTSLRKRTAFDEESAMIIVKEVAKALDHMWNTHRLIHRDIKPSNIMLDTAGHIKLLDFGMSKCTDRGRTVLTKEHIGLGTPGYMSPEQFCDSRNAAVQSDMFSLGATLFFLLTGHAPFRGGSLKELYECTVRNSPPDIRAECPALSYDAEALMRGMMAVRPENRFRSWSEIIRLARSILQ